MGRDRKRVGESGRGKDIEKICSAIFKMCTKELSLCHKL